MIPFGAISKISDAANKPAINHTAAGAAISSHYTGVFFARIKRAP
jgi:hypothetical protein